MVDKKSSQDAGSITINKWVASGLGGLALFVILHTGVLIWTLGSITTTQAHIQANLSEIKSELKEATNDRYFRHEAIEERNRQVIRDREQSEEIRDLRTEVTNIKIELNMPD